jgi:hypothetical protein
MNEKTTKPTETPEKAEETPTLTEQREEIKAEQEKRKTFGMGAGGGQKPK